MPEFAGHVGTNLITPASVPASSQINDHTAGTSKAKGAWVELHPSLDIDADEMKLITASQSATSARYSLDIGEGAAGSETVIIPDLTCSGAFAWSLILIFRFVKGKRYSARIACTTDSATMRVGATWQFAGHGFAGQEATQYGYDPTQLGGVVSDSGGTAHTLGAWVQVAAAIAKRIRTLYVCATNDGTTAAGASAQCRYNFGWGPSSPPATAPLLDQFVSSQTTNLTHPINGPWHVSIPSGSNLYVQHRSLSVVTPSPSGRFLRFSALGIN